MPRRWAFPPSRPVVPPLDRSRGLLTAANRQHRRLAQPAEPRPFGVALRGFGRAGAVDGRRRGTKFPSRTCPGNVETRFPFASILIKNCRLPCLGIFLPRFVRLYFGSALGC